MHHVNVLVLLYFSCHTCRSIIGRDINAFKRNVFEFIYAMPLIAVVNSLLKVHVLLALTTV